MFIYTFIYCIRSSCSAEYILVENKKESLTMSTFELTTLVIDLTAKNYINFIYDFYSAKAFDAEKDLIQIILVHFDGSIETLLATEELYSFKQITLIEKYYTVTENVHNTYWMKGVSVALEINKAASNRYAKKLLGNRIVLVTDFMCELKNYSEKLEKQIENGLFCNNVCFYIVGPLQLKQINMKKISTIEDLRQFCTTVQFKNAHNSNVDVATRLIRKHENSAFAEYENGVAIIEFMKVHKMPMPWYCNMTIGGNDSIKFPICVYRFINESSKAKISKEKSKVMKFYGTQTEEEVDANDVIHVYSMHKNVTPYNSDEDSNWKCSTVKSFELLGFGTNLNQINIYIHGDNNAKVYPDPRTNTIGSCMLFNALFDLMVERNAYAIVSRVYNNNNQYSLNALVPELERRCFILAALPFRNEVIKCYKPNIETTFVPEKEPFSELSENVHEYMENQFENPFLDAHIQRDIVVDLFNRNIIELSLEKTLTKFSLNIKD